MNYYVSRDMSYKKEWDVSSKHRYMPYVPPSYTPSIPQDKTKSCKKQRDASKPLIMSRRFALTTTAYKYLDIGISVAPKSYVEMVLGDNRGHQMVLDHSMWEAIIEKRADIKRLLQLTDVASLRIGSLVIELVKMYNEIIVKLTLDEACMYMKPSTVLFLLELEHCVEHAYINLCQSLEAVNENFDQLVRALQRTLCSSDRDHVFEALRIVYDKTSPIDCELILYAVDELVAETLKRGDVQ